MDEPTQSEVTIRVVEDPTPSESAQRLHALLAIGIERWIRARSAVDFGRDMSVHHDMESGRTQW